MSKACDRACVVARRHPYIVGGGAAIAVTAGIGYVGLATGCGPFASIGQEWRLRRKFGDRGVVENGMLKEAIGEHLGPKTEVEHLRLPNPLISPTDTAVILAPSPTPPILVPLTASLLKAGYVVIVAVPLVKEAEALERRLSGLQEKGALRVLIYDTDDSTTFPPFHRSLLATLTLRFPAPAFKNKGPQTTGDPYSSKQALVPRIHSFISLYPLNPAPPSQPSALPALPTLMSPDANGHTPRFITIYPSSSRLANPDSFGSQVLAYNHRLLATNLTAASGARSISVYVGNITLPSLPAIITEGRALSRREQARQRLHESMTSATAAVSVFRDLFFGTFSSISRSVLYTLGLGAASRDWSMFESRFLRALKSSYGDTYYLGQRSWLPRTLALLPSSALPRVMNVVQLPSETGPAPAPPPKTAHIPASGSASSSDHEGEDLVSSIHTAGTTQSSASSGLEGSWVGLDAH